MGIMRCLTPIDGWWRVIRADGQVNWTDCDPLDVLDGAWQDATVEGPFVPAAQLARAVERAEIAERALMLACEAGWSDAAGARDGYLRDAIEDARAS